MALQVKSLTSIHDAAGSIPSLAHWVKDLALVQAVVLGRRCGSDVALL